MQLLCTKNKLKNESIKKFIKSYIQRKINNNFLVKTSLKHYNSKEKIKQNKRKNYR